MQLSYLSTYFDLWIYLFWQKELTSVKMQNKLFVNEMKSIKK